jgi:DNA mismatch endonuclease, patch repair protein
MGDPPTDEATSLRMARQRRRDTDAELTIRRILHARGLRYRVDAALPGLPRRRADLTFPRQRVAVFIDGCFWHGCPEHKTAPKNNASWWAVKLARNVERDCQTDAHLAKIGWRVVRIWEHEDPEFAADRVEAAVRSGQPGR